MEAESVTVPEYTNEVKVFTTFEPQADPLASSNSKLSPGERKYLYSEEIKSFWNMERIIKELGTREQCIEFAERRGMLSTTKVCRRHRKPMKVSLKGQVGYFRCNKGTCRSTSFSRATGTLFENVHLPLPIVFRIMYCFANEIPYKRAQKECNSVDRKLIISSATVAGWYRYCRESIALHFVENKSKIGGPGKIVQVAETKFEKQKCNKETEAEGHWVLGLVELGMDDLRLELYPGNVRSAEAFILLLKKHVEDGSIIHTADSRKDCLIEHGYIHETFNNSRTYSMVFDDNRKIESLWGNLRRRFHKENYIPNFTEWFIEHSWRKNIDRCKLDEFEELLKCVTKMYKIKGRRCELER